MVTITESASLKVKDLLVREGKVGHGLRVFISGGGCSGFQYGMVLDEQPREGDQVVESGGVKIFIDPDSAPYLSGVQVDYVDSLQGTGFRVSNPNAKSTCGCGQSFSA